ncbi:MAG: AAA family ATPase [Candidatus Lokiarchaeota archaeon]|nr:AAA family ATPase [Candidatus Lokiarchaeota archaeon]
MASYDLTLKVLLLGDPSTGKEEFVNRYISRVFQDDLNLTVGVDFYTKDQEFRGKIVRLQIWDFGGEERFKVLLQSFAKGANGAIIMYDITRYLSLRHLPDWTQIIREHAGNIPIILVGAKAHLEEFRSVDREEGILAAKKYNLSGFIEVSSKTGQNVEKAFETLTRLILIQPQFCHKCKKEFTFEEFLNHPCYETGDVLSTGALNVTGIIARELKQRFLKHAKSEKDKKTMASLHLSLYLPFRFGLENSEIIAAALIRGHNNIIFSTDKWVISDELIKSLSDWNSIKAESIKFSGVKYQILHSSPRQFVTTPNKGETYIVGTKDGRETLLLYLKPKGNVTFDPIKLKFSIQNGKEPESYQYDILLIEDDLATIRLLTSYFESEGVTCKGVTSGAKGLEELVINRPKVVILDIILPDYSGYDICKQIKSIQTFKNIPVFLFPSIGLKNETEKQMEDTKADGYILKPFNYSDFDGIFDILNLHKNKDESTKISKTPRLTDEEILTLARLIHGGKKNMGFYSRSYPEKLMKSAKLRIERLEPSRSGRSLCYVDQSIMESLGIATGDIIEIIGKKRTAGIVVASFSDKGKEIIRIDGIQRLNLGSTIGEFVTIQPALASPAREIELAPTQLIYDIKKQADIIKGKLIDKPIMAGDIIDIPGAFIKTDEDNKPVPGFMRMYNRGGSSKRPTLGPLRLIVLSMKPSDTVVRFTRETMIKINKKVAFLNSSGKLVTSDDIVGSEKEIFEIKKLLELSLNGPSIIEKLNIEPLKGILLVGPTGTGKTLLAKVIANETSYNFISILPSDIFNKYEGDSEKRLKRLFEMAEKMAPCLIFIDHIDSIAPIIQRELIDNMRYLDHRIVTQLMELMDGINPYRNVIVLGATHKLDLIEPALLRPGRFDKIIHFSLPDLISRTKIYQLYTRDLPLDDEISLEEIAKLSENFTGAEIKGVCRLAVINAVKRETPELQNNLDYLPNDPVINTKVTKQDFLSAIEEIADRLK